MELTFLEYEWSPFFLIIVHNTKLKNVSMFFNGCYKLLN